jgi:hypothetical protein
MAKYRRNKIIIDKHKVTLNAVQDFRCLEMNFAGSINTISLLPNNYIIHKGLNKIIIINLNQTSTVFNKSYDLDLFKYKGTAPITEALLINKHKMKLVLGIVRNDLDIWNVLGGYKDDYLAEDIDEKDWAYMTRNWEDLDFDGNNNKKHYIERIKTYDNETKTFTTTKEIRKR